MEPIYEPSTKSNYKKVSLQFENQTYIAENKYTIDDKSLEYLDSFKIYENKKINDINIKVNNEKPLVDDKSLFKIANNEIVLKSHDLYKNKVTINGVVQDYKANGIYELPKESTKHFIHCEYIDENLLESRGYSDTIDNIKEFKPSDVSTGITKPAKVVSFFEKHFKDLTWWKDEDNNEGLCTNKWEYGFVTKEGLPDNFPSNDEFLNFTIRRVRYGILLEKDILVEYNRNESDKIVEIIIKTNEKKPRILAIINREKETVEYRRVKEFLINVGNNKDKTFKFDIDFDKVHPDIKIIGTPDDNNCYTGLPHVTRYIDHYYYAYINDEVYELGQLIDEYKIPLNKRIDLKIGCEYEQYGRIVKGNTKKISFILDTEFPSYPKLTKDLESIMIEPFKIDVLNEVNTDYSANLNGEEWDINSTKPASEKYITDNREFINGEFTLETLAEKDANETFRFRSSYFTINTFQHIPLKPLKTKIIPLEFDSYEVPKGAEGEFVLNSNTGHYGIIHEGKVYSPTLLMSTELLQLEEVSNDVSKLYIKCKKELEVLESRYNTNKKNMHKMFSERNRDYINLHLLSKEINDIRKEIENVNKINNSNKENINALNNNISAIENKINAFKSKIDTDYATAKNIAHNHIINRFSELRETMRLNAELKKYINNILLSEKFEKYMQDEEERFEQFKDAVRKACLNRGESNE